MSTLKSKNSIKMGSFSETSIAPEFADEDRITILTLLQKVLHNPEISPVAWLCLWLADLSSLQSMYTMATLPGGQATVLLALESVDERFLQTWLDQAVPACPSDSVVFHDQPSHLPDIEGPMHPWEMDAQGRYCRVDLEYEMKVCLARDERSCILTRETDSLEIAHIIPNRTRSSPSPGPTRRVYPITNPLTNTNTETNTDKFWKTLSLFWTKPTVAAWAHELNAQNNGTNMLTMAPHVHAAWSKARFALQPLSHSRGKTLTAQFVWLKFRRAEFPQRGARVRIMRRPVVTCDGKGDVGPRGLKFWDRVSEEKVGSGKVVSFRVNCDEFGGCPLPSWELLRMQWVLRRIVAFSGVGDGDGDGDGDWDDGVYDCGNGGKAGRWMDAWTGEGEDTQGDALEGEEGHWWEGHEDEEEYDAQMDGHGWKADDRQREHEGNWVGRDAFQEPSDASGWYPLTPETPETESEQVEQYCETIGSISYIW